MHSTAAPFLLTLTTLVLGWPLLQPPGAALAAQRYVGAWQRSAPPPVSDGVRAGNTLYLAGHLGLDPPTGGVPRDGAAEARLLMDSVQRTVTGAGLRMDDLVSVTVFSTDTRLEETFDAVYRSYFHGRYPARGFVRATALQCGAHFEVLGVAVRPSRLQL